MFYDIIGTIGVFLCLLAYALLHFKKLTFDQFGYSALNFFGAVLILITLVFFSWNFSAFLMEVSWLIISFWGLWKYRKGNKPANDVAS